MEQLESKELRSVSDHMRCPRIPEHNPNNVDLVRYFVINVRFETKTYKKQASRVVILIKLFMSIIYMS